MHRIVSAAFVLLALPGCSEAPLDPSPTTSAKSAEFPPPQELGNFNDRWFVGSRMVTFVERAEEDDGFRALGVDVDNLQVIYQVVGPREAWPEVAAGIAKAGLQFPGCGIGQGVFTPPPIPPPKCGGLRCQPGDFITRAIDLVAMMCP